ncbi:Uncharacterized protein dnl_09020 [Desulfonema limicola]|uniref:Uncharacterized protein n=1 Tax=Desulfonema limicola TaxID=45656 RepID=A0A975GEY3_9BACT|nr:hypothetical protein [Desulfonema limicola]QTA78673.1 Uncharacterized protein dnl_09020 [Desulfonema limicola]
MKNNKSNLNIRSNLYPLPKDFLCYNTEISEVHRKFVRQIRDSEIFEKLPNKLKMEGTNFQNNNFGVCSSHPRKEVSYGPIKKGERIVFGCRCIVKDTCRNRKILNLRERRERGKDLDCKKCPRFKG